MSLVRLPPGAARMAKAPPSVAWGPLAGKPSESTVVDEAAFWRVPMAYASLMSWVPSHPPAGLVLTSSADGGQGLGYSASASARWQSAQLDLTMGPLTSSTSVLRADAVIVWLDPRPLPDNQPWRRARVLVDGNCPVSVASYVGVENPGTGLRDRLLPPGLPTAGLMCSYHGYHFGPGRSWPLGALARTVHLSPAAAVCVAKAVAALAPSHTDGGDSYGRAGASRYLVLAFSYPQHPDIDLWVELGSYAEVANGYISAAVVGAVGTLLASYR
jgi:hypothetical protein